VTEGHPDKVAGASGNIIEKLQCIICGGGLMDRDKFVKCKVCDYLYKKIGSSVDLLPNNKILLSKGFNRRKIKIWHQAQTQFEERAITDSHYGKDEVLQTINRPDSYAGYIYNSDTIRGNVLDIGTGPVISYISEGIVRDINSGEAQVFGLDPWQSKGCPANFVPAIGELNPFKDEMFDRIIINSVLDHTLNPKMVISEAFRVLKPGGKLIIGSILRDTEFYDEYPTSFQAWINSIKSLSNIFFLYFLKKKLYHPTPIYTNKLLFWVMECGFVIDDINITGAGSGILLTVKRRE
jgi:SAM-dependent methyltransferase